MRSKERLIHFYSELEFIHKEFFQDLRFGQFIHVFFNWINNNYMYDVFYLEEDIMIEKAREFAKTSYNYNGCYDYLDRISKTQINNKGDFI